MAIVAWLAALNPARTRLGLPERDGRTRMEIVGPGVSLGLAVLFAVAALSGPILDALEISPEMFRIAAGLVLMIAAAWMIFAPVPADEPIAKGWVGAVWPVAFPRVIKPETIILALTTGASDGLMISPIVIAGATLVGLGSVPLGPTGRRVLAALGRLFAAALVVVAVVLAVAGIREV